MGTTADKLNLLIAAKDAIKRAIVAKGGTIFHTDNFRSYADRISEITGETMIVSPLGASDVNFYNSNGAILYSYTKEEFLAITGMPPLPSMSRMICQGWNWTIEAAKAYVNDYGRLDIGASYITDDGKTRLYIHIADSNRMEASLYYSQNMAEGVTIDWGDGSPLETSSKFECSLGHTYAFKGDYVITLDVEDGCKIELGNSPYNSIMGYTSYSYGKWYPSDRVSSSMLQRVEIGKNVNRIDTGAFQFCNSLSTITIPESVTSIGSYAFQECCSLASVVLPQGVTEIGSNAFQSCNSLSTITIPESVTSIDSYAFQDCCSLASVIIPPRVLAVGNHAFIYASALSTLIIPESFTSIGDYAFADCYSLASVVFSQGVTGIGSNAFGSCYGIILLDFQKSIAVPTLLNKNAISEIKSRCRIVVPDPLYDEWIAATNWSTYASQIVKASEYNG